MIADEKVRCRNISLCRVQRRVEREAGGGIIARRLVRRDGAAQRASVTNSRITNITRQGRQRRQMPAHIWRPSDLGVGRSSSNRDRVLTMFNVSRNNSTDVHQAGRELQTELHVPQKHLSASEQ